MNIGEVHLDKRYRDSQKGVSQDNAGMGKSGRVKDDEIDPVAGIVDEFNQFVFRVALDEFKLMTRGLSRAGEPDFDAIQVSRP